MQFIVKIFVDFKHSKGKFSVKKIIFFFFFFFFFFVFFFFEDIAIPNPKFLNIAPLEFCLSMLCPGKEHLVVALFLNQFRV